jgi:hypothetical protein
MGLLSGDNTTNLAIGILRADQGSYMSRHLLGFVLAFNRGDDGTGGGGVGGR